MSGIQKLFIQFLFKHTASVADTLRGLHINFENNRANIKVSKID